MSAIMTADRIRYEDWPPLVWIQIHGPDDVDGETVIGTVTGHGPVSLGCWHAHTRDGTLAGVFKDQRAAREAVLEAFVSSLDARARGERAFRIGAFAEAAE
jgi:hypothetical protein